MKHDLNLVDPPLLKLGPKVVEWRPISKVEYDLIGRAFELAGFESINFGRLRGITEADCRQVTLELEMAGRQTSQHDSRITQSVVLPLSLTGPLKVTRVLPRDPGPAFTTWFKVTT